MTAERRAYLLAAADRLLADGDRSSARIVLDVVAFDDRYRVER